VRAVEGLLQGALKTNTGEKIALTRSDAVRLTMSPAVPADIRNRIDALAQQITGGAGRKQRLRNDDTMRVPHFANGGFHGDISSCEVFVVTLL
jgi:hypothetical protein